MFRPKSRKRKRQSERESRRQPSRRLFLESLESRRLLAGVVNLDITAGDLTIEGDSSNNQVEVRAGAATGQLIVTGKSGTLLTLGTSTQTFSTLTVNGVIDDLIVDLAGGNDTFELGTAAGTRTNISDDVTISNDDDDENFIRNADIGGDLLVDRASGGSAGSSDLTILDTIIRGSTTVDNDGAGGMEDGDSKTIIERSELEGTLSIENAEGDDTTIIADTSIGAALFVRPPTATTDPILDIHNGDGSSFTSITSKNDPAGTTPLPPGTLNRPTVYGSIHVSNGSPAPSGTIVAPPTTGTLPSGIATTVDIVVVNQADVLGELDVENFDGHSEVIVVDSNIGTDTKPATSPGGYGGPITVANGDGFDIFELNRSKAQYGVFITNNSAAGQTWGSHSLVADSEVGKRVPSGPAFSLIGDDGDDVFNISDATRATMIHAGGLSLDLLDGDDEVSIVGVAGNNVRLESLMISGGDGDDGVVLRNAEVESMLKVELHAGVDRLELRVLASELPNALIGSILLDGGVGADFFTIPAGIPFTSFETPIT